MKCIVFLFCLLLKTVKNKEQDIFKSNINKIIQDLSYRQWEADENFCFERIIAVLDNVKNGTLWATFIWDSMHLPTGVLYGNRLQLGNFDECLRPPWKQTHPDIQTQYCLADVVLTEKEITFQEDPFTTAASYIKSTTNNRLRMNSIVWGVCLPESCHPKSVEKFITTLIRNSHLGFALPQLSINVDSCQSDLESPQRLYGLYVFFIFIGMMMSLVTWGTCYYKYRKHDTNVVTRISKGLSAVENTMELGRVRNNEIRILNCIKTFSTATVVTIHSIAVSVYISCSNNLDIDRKFQTEYSYLLHHIDVCVDNYILISGILMVKGFMENKNSFHPFKIIVKRYFRLAGLMMATITIVVLSLRQLTAGPVISKSTLIEYDNCKDNWWLNFLMINNYVNFSNTCYPASWYVALDFQLTILGTLIFWLYRKNNRLGITIFILFAMSSILLPTIATYRQQLLAFPRWDFETFRTLRQTLEDSPTYLRSHHRSGPYLIGMVVGYILSTCKPSEYRLSKVSSIACLIVASILALSVVIVGANIVFDEYDVLKSAIYAGINRSIWALAVSLFILINEYGYLPIIQHFVNSPVFGSISKLCYGIYLTHFYVLCVKAFSSRSAIFCNVITLVVDSLGVMSVCSFMSYLLWILVEAPLNNIVALILRYRFVTKKFD